MSIKFIKRIPSSDAIIEQIPLPQHIKAVKAKRDREIRDIFEGKDDRLDRKSVV